MINISKEKFEFIKRKASRYAVIVILQIFSLTYIVRLLCKLGLHRVCTIGMLIKTLTQLSAYSKRGSLDDVIQEQCYHAKRDETIKKKSVIDSKEEITLCLTQA